jgi:hypothetical protein
MNKKVSTLIALGMACCSMQAVPKPPAATIATAPRMIARTIPLEQPSIAKDSKGLPPPRTCLLGSDCLTMDSHPFEVCQVSTKSCGDKLAEVLQVEALKSFTPPAPKALPISR